MKRFLEYLDENGRDFGKTHATKLADRFLNDKDLSGMEKMDDIYEHDLYASTPGKG